jgi:hypothetical protein
MTDLFLHGRKLDTVFDLLGSKENDITYSVGWALAQSPAFCARLMAAATNKICLTPKSRPRNDKNKVDPISRSEGGSGIMDLSRCTVG